MQQDLNNKEVRFTIDFFEKVLFKGKLLNFDNEAIEKLTEC